MTGLYYYVLSELSTRKTGSLLALRNHLRTKAVGLHKYYCITVQLDEMIREIYPKSGAKAIASLMDIIAPELKAGKKADFSLFKAELKARYMQKYRSGVVYMDQVIAINSDITDRIPMISYNFIPKEDTVENATTAYMIGLFVMFHELVFFKSMAQFVDELERRGILSQNAANKQFMPIGDRDQDDVRNYGFKRPEEGSSDLMGYTMLFARALLIPKMGLIGAKASMRDNLIQIDVDSGHVVNRTDILKKLMSLYNKIIS